MSSPQPLWHHHDFRQLWAAETVSQVGTQVTMVALPLLAVTLLHATPFQMGVLTALETLAFLVVGLPAGAWVDRWRRKRVLVTGDLVRAVAFGSLPLAAALGVLTLGQLYVVALLAGTATVFFDVGYQSYLPSLVDRAQIVDGNSKLEASRAVAQVAGPGLAGALIRVLGAPALIAFDAVSFLLSALFIGRIRHADTVPDRADRRPLRTEIAEGLSFVVRHPLLRRMVACTGLANLAGSATDALLVLYAVRRLGLSASVVGLVFSAGAVGGLVGAVAAARIARVIGEGRTIPLSAVVFAGAGIAVPLASLGAPVPLLLAGWFLESFGVIVYNVTQVSFRQRLCPPGLLGRMNASVRFIVFGTMPVGAFLGGALGTWLGLVPALWIAVAGQFLAAVPVLASPLIRMRDLPDAWDGGRVPDGEPVAPATRG
jgi:MFS family permease